MSTKFLDFFSKRKPPYYSPCCFTVCSGAPQQNCQLCLLVITTLHEKLPIYSTKNPQGWLSKFFSSVYFIIKQVYGLNIHNTFIFKGFDVNAEILNGRSGIHFAADYGQSNVIEYLLSKGADINVSFPINFVTLSLTKACLSKGSVLNLKNLPFTP